MDDSPLATVTRAFDVIEHLRRIDGVGPAELARRMEIPRSTAHDYLRALASTGYVVREDGVYSLSYKFLTVGGRKKYRDRLFYAARSALEKLADATGEVANVNVPERGLSMILHQERGEQSLNLGTYPGIVTPLHSHAAGKAILAYLPEERLSDIMESHGLPEMTDETITDRDALTTELKSVWENGYAVDWDEQVVGMGVVAAPILVDEMVYGSVAIVCPSGRLQDRTNRDQFVQRVTESAHAISINFRYGT